MTSEHPTGHPGGHPGGHPVVREMRYDLNERPFIVIWEVTRACQLVCRHCRADAQHRRHPDELTTEQGKALLDTIAGFGRPHPMVVLTGGDCFEREDLVELVRHGSEAGLSMSISPSVTPLLTRERIQALRDAGGKAMSVSLDGATAETHDRFRGFPGTFDATMRAARWITEAGFRFQVNTVFTAGNVREMPMLLADVLGMGAWMWYTFFLVPTGRGSELQALSPADKEDLLHWLHDNSERIAIKTTEAPQYRRVALERDAARREGRPLEPRGELHAWLTAETERLIGPPEHTKRPRSPMAINAGSGFAFVDHLGDVYPSGFLPQRCGNVKETSFRTIYTDSPIMRRLRQPETFDGKCGVCEFNHVCGGSRSHAYAVTGNLFASDPTCVHMPAAALAADDVPPPAAPTSCGG